MVSQLQSLDKLVNHSVSMILKIAVLGRKRTFGSIPSIEAEISNSPIWYGRFLNILHLPSF